MNSQNMLDKIRMTSLEPNKESLLEFDLKLEYYLRKRKAVDYVANLYACEADDGWFTAQCVAARRQIAKVLDENSIFYKYYSGLATERDLILLTKELICDVAELNWHGAGRLELDRGIGRGGYLPSNQFFLHAKFSYFERKHVAETTQRNFDISSMPVLIRQAIEIKVKNMIGMRRVTTKNGRFKLVSISMLLDFFEKHRQFIDFPVDIGILKAINTWTNTFVHTGIVPLCWQSLEAIDLIEDLFEIEDKRTGALHLHGFTYLKTGVTLDVLKTALDNRFDANFSLDEKAIEGVRRQH